MTNKHMTVTSRGVTLRDFTIFQVKLALDGAKDFFAFWLAICAIVLDFIAGRGSRPRLFYSVVRASERFDKWINLHSVVQRMDEERSQPIEDLEQKAEELRKKIVDPPQDSE